jgi:hypothetical protein
MPYFPFFQDIFDGPFSPDYIDDVLTVGARSSQVMTPELER